MTAGFVNVLKPPGMSSADVVGVAKRLLRERQIGHLGTLDPLAAGVLPLAVGYATRLIVWLPPRDTAKEYIAEALLGIETDSQDGAGRVVERRDVPSLSIHDMHAALARMQSTTEQIPPMASALHHEGKRLYDLHRAGIEVERAARAMVIEQVELLRWHSPRLLFRVRCSVGTYVRTLCHDLGRDLGCGAHMAFLVRTASGSFELGDAVPLEDLSPTAIVEAGQPMAAWPAVTITDLGRLRNGQAVLIEGFDGTVRLLRDTGELLGMGRGDGTQIHPACVLPPAFI